MAKYTNRIQPLIAEYDAEAMTYLVTIQFTAEEVSQFLDIITEEGVGDWATTDWTIWQAKLPAKVTLEHLGKNIWGTPYTQEVTCWPVGRRIDNTTSVQTLDVHCAFQGRVEGTHRISMRTQMVSEILAQGLKKVGPPGKEFYPGIGPDFQGVARDIPLLVYSVIECVPLPVEGIIEAANLITGSVNEQNWKPPWTEFFTMPVGEFLYLGPADVSIDRRTRSAIITHDFARLQSRAKQHIYDWYGYEQDIDDESGRLVRKYDLEKSMADIQLIAGTDMWWDGVTPIPPFAALLLGPEKF